MQVGKETLVKAIVEKIHDDGNVDISMGVHKLTVQGSRIVEQDAASESASEADLGNESSGADTATSGQEPADSVGSSAGDASVPATEVDADDSTDQ